MTRITVSFIPAPRLTRIVLGGGWAIAVGLALLAAWIAADTLSTRQELPLLERRLTNLEHQFNELAGARQPMPPPAELDAMRARVSRLNAVSVVRGWSSAEVLQWLESHMAKDVHLVSFHHRAREAELLIVAEARSASELTAFLSVLEREPRFSEVLLSKQASHIEDGVQSVQFEIKVRLRT